MCINRTAIFMSTCPNPNLPHSNPPPTFSCAHPANSPPAARAWSAWGQRWRKTSLSVSLPQLGLPTPNSFRIRSSRIWLWRNLESWALHFHFASHCCFCCDVRVTGFKVKNFGVPKVSCGLPCSQAVCSKRYSRDWTVSFWSQKSACQMLQ